MIKYCINNLNEVKDFLNNIDSEYYTSSLDCLSGGSIGQHIRHVLEFYICLMDGVGLYIVCYDNRKRELKLENDKDFAIYTIRKIVNNLPLIPQTQNMSLVSDFGIENDAESVTISTSVERELAYCLEHSIHHMALIKIALNVMGLKDKVSDSFGVATSTIKNKKTICAQ